jgi:hypothetical protein
VAIVPSGGGADGFDGGFGFLRHRAGRGLWCFFNFAHGTFFSVALLAVALPRAVEMAARIKIATMLRTAYSAAR